MPGWLQQEQAAGFDRKPRLASLESADLVAARPIEAGEELTIDYQMTLWFTPE
jgi:hypothetical protein